MGQHTPLPWANDCFVVKSLANGAVGIYGGIVICHTGGWDVRNGRDAEANAEFIVRACNSHYQLDDQ